MSGHSKWAQIKRSKGTADVKKGTLFTKLAQSISVVAREGGGNPEMNFKLRIAVDKAKQANMPKESIERAIKKGTGELGGAMIESVVYEFFGPGGVAFVIEALTDNKNRTVAEIKHILNKYGASLAGQNSVLWMFERKGIIHLSEEISKERMEEIELRIIELGADDIREDKKEIVIYTKQEDLQKVKEGLEKENFKIDYAEIEMIAKNRVKIEDSKIKEKLESLLTDLDECSDINNHYSNEE